MFRDARRRAAAGRRGGMGLALRLAVAATVAALLVLGRAETSWAASRLALVMGNAAYGEADDWTPLPSVRNDVREMRALLRSMGFTVLPRDDRRAVDLDRTAMEDAVLEMKDALARGEGSEVAVVFFSGHGMKIGDANYLIPVGARIDREEKAASNAYSAETILREIGSAPGRLNLVFLDACRTDPFVKGRGAPWKGAENGAEPGGQGFGAFGQRAGTVISYASAPGMPALAVLADQPHSPYTAALVGALGTPGLTLQQVLSQVETEVVGMTEGMQVPHMEARASLLDWVARPAPAPAPAPAVPEASPAAPAPPVAAVAVPQRQPQPQPAPPAPQPPGTGVALVEVLRQIVGAGAGAAALPYRSPPLPPLNPAASGVPKDAAYTLRDGRPIDLAGVAASPLNGMVMTSYIPTIQDKVSDDPRYARYLSGWPSETYSHNAIQSPEALEFFREMSDVLVAEDDLSSMVTNCCDTYSASYYVRDGRRFVFVYSSTEGNKALFLIEIDRDRTVLSVVNLSGLYAPVRLWTEDLHVPAALLHDQSLYFCVTTNGMSLTKAGDSFMVRLDLASGTVRWISQLYACNAGFTHDGTALVAPFGGTGAEDFIYRIDPEDGRVLARTRLETGAGFVVNVGGAIHGVRYNDVPFVLTPNP